MNTTNDTDDINVTSSMGESRNLPNCWVDVWVKAVLHKSPNNTWLSNTSILQRQNKDSAY